MKKNFVSIVSLLFLFSSFSFAQEIKPAVMEKLQFIKFKKEKIDTLLAKQKNPYTLSFKWTDNRVGFATASTGGNITLFYDEHEALVKIDYHENPGGTTDITEKYYYDISGKLFYYEKENYKMYRKFYFFDGSHYLLGVVFEWDQTKFDYDEKSARILESSSETKKALNKSKILPKIFEKIAESNFKYFN